MNSAVYEGKDLEAMSLAPNYHAWILRAFLPFLGDRVAEVGAGSGTFSALLLPHIRKELITVEPAQEMFHLLETRFSDDVRVTCRCATFSEVGVSYPEALDSILYINVLEHIKDDEGELRHAARALKEGGTLGIFVPALPWLFGEHDRSVGHERRYDKRSLKKVLEKAGFEIITLRYFDIAGVLPWFILMRVMKRRLTGQNASLYDAFVVPIMSKIESYIAPPFGKNLIAVARKRR